MRTCKRGHDLDEVGQDPNGRCSECRRASVRERRVTDPEWTERERARDRARFENLSGYEYNRKLLRGRRNSARFFRKKRDQQRNEEN